MWPSNESMSSAMTIKAQEGGLYKVTSQVIQALAHICVFRTDNGKDLDSHKYYDLYRDFGIKRELIMPYNPQQNGVAIKKERDNL
jgi:transposase InsO family protein